jgi:hypothetical protein
MNTLTVGKQSSETCGVRTDNHPDEAINPGTKGGQGAGAAQAAGRSAAHRDSARDAGEPLKLSGAKLLTLFEAGRPQLGDTAFASDNRDSGK